MNAKTRLHHGRGHLAGTQGLSNFKAVSGLIDQTRRVNPNVAMPPLVARYVRIRRAIAFVAVVVLLIIAMALMSGCSSRCTGPTSTADGMTCCPTGQGTGECWQS